jgi:hypothetical protein
MASDRRERGNLDESASPVFTGPALMKMGGAGLLHSSQ